MRMSRFTLPTRNITCAWLFALLAGCLTFVALVIRISAQTLNDWDEAIYAEAAKEMLTRHSWLTPYWNGAPWFEKPPLYLWCQMVLSMHSGVSERSARLPSCLAGALLCAVIFYWSCRVRGLRCACLSAAILVLTTGFFATSRQGMTDTLLTLALYVSLAGLYATMQGNAIGWVPFWLGLAIGFMTKSAAILPVFGPFVWTTLHNTARRTMHTRSMWLGTSTFLLLVLPWHLLMLRAHGQPFLHEYFGYHVLSRVFAPLEGNGGGALFYLQVLKDNGSPWVYFLPLAFPLALFRHDGFERLLLCFFLTTFVLYTAAQTKLWNYVTPLYPALALLLGSLCDFFLGRYSRKAAVGLVVLFAIALTIVVPELHSYEVPQFRPDLQLLKSTPPGQITPPLIVCSGKKYFPMPAVLFYSHTIARETSTEKQFSAVSTKDKLTIPIKTISLESRPWAIMDAETARNLPGTIHFTRLAGRGDIVLGRLTPR